MNCARIKLSAATTTIFVRDGWLIIEAADAGKLRSQLNGTDGARLMSVAEVSERTGFTSGAVRGWINRGVLAAVRIGKEYRVREGDLEAFLGVRKGLETPVGAADIPSTGGRRRKAVSV